MSSFGPTDQTKSAMSGLQGISDQSKTNSGAQIAQGGNLLNLGSQPVQAGTNFFTSLLNGNRADAGAALQPSIDQIREGQQGTLQSANALMPRGGGRFSTLFGSTFSPHTQIQNLFNSIRTQAGQTLPQIGAQEQQLGSGLFGLGNQALSTGVGANTGLADISQRQQQMTNQLWSSLGSGLFGLATTPFGGGATANGLLGLIRH